MADSAKNKIDTIKSQNNYKLEKQAYAIMQKIDTLKLNLKAINNIHDPKDPAYRKINKAVLQSIVKGADLLLKKFPGSAYCQQGRRLKEMYLQ